MLECVDGSYYTRIIINIDKRLVEHQEGKGATILKSDYRSMRLPKGK